jgi:Ca2+-binding EF-hand superfamily protein
MKHIIKTVLLFVLTFTVGTTFAKPKNKGKQTDPVAAYLKQNDKNDNGTIEKSEAHMGDETFAKWDKDKNGKLDKDEIKSMLHVPDKKPKKK